MTATAPGKAILFGEHAVVYGRPAIAVPVHALQARASLQATQAGEPGQLWIEAPDIGFSGQVELEPGARGDDDLVGQPGSGVAGLALAVRLGLEHFGAAPAGPLRLQLRSEIPVAAGMGSSAAVAVAVLRAVAAFLGQQLAPEAASRLAYRVEQHYHGQPSGIDNSVVAYGAPIYFVRDRPPAPIAVAAPFSLILADSGRPAATRELVAGVRARWSAQRSQYERLFDAIGELVEGAREAIQSGQPAALGPLMDRNQTVLERIGVSTPELEALIRSARSAGAQGAKLSGAGGGGLLIALAGAERLDRVRQALRDAGAARVLVTEVGR